MDLKGSHGGVHGTLCHLIFAQQVWLARWTGRSAAEAFQPLNVASLDDLRPLWASLDSKTHEFLKGMTEVALQGTIKVVTSDGEEYTDRFSQMLPHLVNHSSYHRGQIAAMLRQLGAKPAGTDLITYYRQRDES